MALTVYEHPLSPYAQKVKIALREKGVDFTRPCRREHTNLWGLITKPLRLACYHHL